MLFAGIIVPPEVKVADTDLLAVGNNVEPLGETAGNAIMGGIALAAFWGENLVVHGFNPDFAHGIFDADGSKTDSFDVPRLVDLCAEMHAVRMDFEKNFNFGDTDHTRFDVPRYLHDGLRATAGFYDRDIRKIISAAVNLRIKILKLQTQGDIYGLTANGEDWWPVTLHPGVEL